MQCTIPPLSYFFLLFSMNSTDVWQFLADSIVKLAIGEIDAELQWFCSSGLTTPCSLIDSNGALNTDVVYQLGNSIPALSNAYIPFSDLFSSYQLFLNMLTPAALGCLLYTSPSPRDS